MINAGLAYSPRSSALGRAGAGAATIHLLAIAAVAFLVSNPIVLAGCAAAVVLAGVTSGGGRALALAARWAAGLGVAIVVINAVASQRGDTILVRGPDAPVLGPIDISAEALAEGGMLALRIAIVLGVFAVHTAVVNPDRLLRLARPLAARSALTATLMTRLVPLAIRDHARVREATALRGPGAASVGRATILRRLVAGALDRAIDVAATLELRGYANSAPKRRGRSPRAPGDRAFALSGLAGLLFIVAARASGVADYEAYPTISMDAGVATMAVAATLPIFAMAPVLADRFRASRFVIGVPARV